MKNKYLKYKSIKTRYVKILFMIIIIVMSLKLEVCAKYNYSYTLNAYSLRRDSSEILYEMTRTEEEKEYTNQDVLLTINFNKPIYEIDGFTISEDGRTLTKTIAENETNTIIAKDISGNYKEIAYEINNIDKIPPEILGIEDNKTYNTDVVLNYQDNIGIKEINVDKYSNLKLSLYNGYYDIANFKGTDMTDTTANIRVVGHPKYTKSYRYYIDDILKAESKETQYKFTELKKGTSYIIKVEAIDVNGNVLETATRTVKTKTFSRVSLEKDSTTGTCEVKVYGIDPSIDNAIAIGYSSSGNQKVTYPVINSNGNLTEKFYAKDITGNIKEGYYYFHIQLYDNGVLIDTVTCNVIFVENFYENTDVDYDLYNLKSNGNYQITVVDLAGNETTKTVIISK